MFELPTRHYHAIYLWMYFRILKFMCFRKPLWRKSWNVMTNFFWIFSEKRLENDLKWKRKINETNIFLNAYQNKLELQVKLKWLHFCPPLLIISLEIFHTGIILLHVHSQGIYCNCVKFHNYHFIHQEGVALTRIWAHRPTRWFLYIPQ